jgi:chemotaxis protein CheY-P-specific phosphatase CheC
MITQEVLDEFAIITRRGAENAGSTLSKWLHRQVHIDVSTVELIRLDLIPEEAVDDTDATITLVSRVKGKLPGNVAVQLAYSDAKALVTCLGGNLPPGDHANSIGEMQRSMLQETANVLFSSLMNSLAGHLGLSAVPYAPSVLVDLGTSAWATLLLESAEEADEAVVVTARFACIGSGPKIRLVFIPAPEALAVIRRGINHDQR